MLILPKLLEIFDILMSISKVQIFQKCLVLSYLQLCIDFFSSNSISIYRSDAKPDILILILGKREEHSDFEKCALCEISESKIKNLFQSF